MQLSNSPGKLVLPFASSGNKNAIPVNSQIGITPGAASLADGFPPLTMTPVAAGGVPPSGLDMNGILYELSDVIRWANAGGGYTYDAAFATDSNIGGYPKGARLLRADGLGYWFNTVENNTVDPDDATAGVAAAAGWVPDFTSGAAAVTMTSANVTLTPEQYGKPVVVITGLLTANLNLIFPPIVEEWTVINGTTGAFTITAKNATGVGVELTQGRASMILNDGAEVHLLSFKVKDVAKIASSIANLRDFNKMEVTTALVLGYYAAGDGGGGCYYYDPADVSSVDNGGAIIVANDGGRWKLSQVTPFSPEQFGAKGDGITDDSAKFLALIEFLHSNGGGSLQCSPLAKTYIINSGLPAYSDIIVDLNGCTLDASGLVDAGNFPRVFFGQGNYGAINSLTANCNRGEMLVLANNTNYTANDLVIVGSHLAFDASNTNTHRAELCFVRSADATTVNLQAPLISGYATVNTAYIQRIVPVKNFKLCNGIIIGPTYNNVASGKAPYILQIHGGNNIIVEDVVFKRVSFAGVSLVDCIFSKVSASSFEESAETNELAYGVSFGNCTQDSVAIGNSFYNRRHAMTTNNFGAIGGYGNSLRGIVRRCKFSNNVVYRAALYTVGSGGDAIDTHGACEDIEILDNTVFYSTGNGINFEGRSGIIRGNTIYFADAWGIRVHNETDLDGTIIVDNNKILSVKLGGIFLQSGYRGGGKGFVSYSICGNQILETTDVDGIYIDDSTTANQAGAINNNSIQVGQNGIQLVSTEKATISGNAIISGAECINLFTSDGYCSINGNVLETTSVASRGISLIASQKTAICGNSITMPAGATSAGVFVTSTGTTGSSENTVTGNAVYFRGANTGYGVLIGNTYSNYNGVFSNNVRGANTGISLGTGNTGNVQANNII